MPHLLYIPFLFALGACVGSFLNVVVWRLPRGESLVTPPSRCPVCGTRLAWYDNIPVFGWIFLRGRCRYCYNPVSARYPTVELITGLLFVLYYVMFFLFQQGPCQPGKNFANLDLRQHWALYVAVVLTLSALLAASLIDAELFWIPQSIPMVIAVVGLIYHTFFSSPTAPGSVHAAASGQVFDPVSRQAHGPVAGYGGLMAAGGTLGLLVALALVWLKVLPRSFSQGYPALEIDKEAEAAAADNEAPDQTPEKPGLLARLIDAYRGTLPPAKQAVMDKQRRAMEAREKELAREQEREAQAAARRDAEQRQKAGQPEEPPPAPKEFTRADIRREMRREMLFLLFPLVGAAAAALLVNRSPALAAAWRDLLKSHAWLAGLLGALLGGLVGAFAIWLTRVLGSVAFGREAMGMGDVDLMFGVGTVIGAGPVVVAFFAAPFFGIAFAVYMLLTGKRRELPYGPYLSLGTAFAMLYACDVMKHLLPGLEAMRQMIP